MKDLARGPYQHLPFALPNYIFPQNMTRVTPLLRMLEVRPYRALVHHICSHLMGGIFAAEQHAGLAYPCAAFEGTVEDVMLIGQVFIVFYR